MQDQPGDSIIPLPQPDALYPASDLIEQFAQEYLHEIFRNHFPCFVDGLKTVYRRWIFSQYTSKLTESVTKSSRAVSELSATHPYNESSMYDVIMRMAQPWVFYPQMAVSPSNNGSYSGNNAGAVRYTEVGMAEYTREMFLDGIDVVALPKVEGPYLDLEPMYYIPALPTALINDNLTIGFAVGCLTARLDFGNVCDLVCDYVRHRITNPHKPWDYKALAAKFLPDFTTPCIVTNAAELTEAYSRGNFNLPIEMDGRVVITKDRISVQALPHGIAFRNIIDVFENHLRQNPNGEIRKLTKDYNFTRSKKMAGDFSIFPKQNVSALTLWKLIAPVIKFYGRYYPNPNYSMLDQTTIAPVSYPNIIAGWYKQRVMILSATKRRRLQGLQRRRQIQEAQIVVAKFPDRCLDIIQNTDTEEEVIEKFAAEFGLTPFQSKALLDQNIRALLKTSVVKLQEQLDRTIQTIKDLTGSFNDIGDDIIRTAMHLKRKYDKGRRSHIPRYIGFITFETGNVLYESAEDAYDIMQAFPKDKAVFTPFTSPYQEVLDDRGKPQHTPLHKYMWGTIVSVPTKDGMNGTYTMCIRDGTVCQSYGFKPTLDLNGVFYVPKKIVGLTRYGKVRRQEVTDFSKRVNCLTTKGAQNDTIYVVPDDGEVFYIAQFNTADPNILTLQCVRPDQGGYVTNPQGELFLFYSKTGEDWYITPPESCLNRFGARAIRIIDARSVIPEGARSIRYDLLTRSRKNPNIVFIE